MSDATILAINSEMPHETHASQNVGWLRAAVLGANDGIVSIACLLVGVAAADASKHNLLITALAGVFGGAMSMAAGEYVSVSSQADAEDADLAKEEAEIEKNPEAETIELAQIYVARGLDEKLALQVAKQLMDHDALGSHARDELGITEELAAHPLQAAGASAVSFATGGFIPSLGAIIATQATMIHWIFGASLCSLVAIGMLAAYVGGAPVVRSGLRVGFWGAIAMALTAGMGRWVGTSI